MDIKAKKSLGQNFLVNQGILEKIIIAAEITSNDKIVEVGPGKGALTELLAKRAGSVVAIEKDHRLIEHLASTVGERANVHIIEGDVLDWTPPAPAGKYKIVANLPYYITSHFLRIMFESWPQPSLAVLMVQKEVAQRIVAKPPHMNLLALCVQYFSQASIVAPVSAGSFRPVPKVDSAIIKLVLIGMKPDEALFKVIRAGFHAPRKQLANNLHDVLAIEKDVIHRLMTEIGLAPTIRSGLLSLDQWKQLSAALAPLLQS